MSEWSSREAVADRLGPSSTYGTGNRYQKPQLRSRWIRYIEGRNPG